MKNNSENKARFFELYYGQMVRIWKEMPEELTKVSYAALTRESLPNACLSLRSISNLTDNEIEECARIMQYSSIVAHKWNKSSIIQGAYIGNLWSNCTDYLRSIGILIPFMGLSTETIIEYGWAKINNPQ